MAIAPDPASELGLGICKALDIDTDEVTRLMLVVQPGQIPRLTIERYVLDEEEVEGFVRVFDEYMVVRRDD